MTSSSYSIETTTVKMRRAIYYRRETLLITTRSKKGRKFRKPRQFRTNKQRNSSESIQVLELGDLKGVTSFTAEPISIIDQGTYATVVLARCPERGDKLCAVKIMELRDRDGRFSDAVHRTYLRELSVLLALRDLPYTQTLLGYAQTHNRAFIATEYYPNRDLSAVQSSFANKKLPEELVQFYCAEICEGIRQIHSRGFMHRNIKAENILVDRHGHIKIGDFAFADISEFSNDVVGTPCFMSPERLKKEYYDKSSDYWSVGVTLFEALFDCLPHDDAATDSQEHKYKLAYEEISFEFCRGMIANKDAHDFLKQILMLNKFDRLGWGPDGSENVMQHPYLAGFDRKLLEKGELPPPVIPTIKQLDEPLNKTVPKGHIQLSCI